VGDCECVGATVPVDEAVFEKADVVEEPEVAEDRDDDELTDAEDELDAVLADDEVDVPEDEGEVDWEVEELVEEELAVDVDVDEEVDERVDELVELAMEVGVEEEDSAETLAVELPAGANGLEKEGRKDMGDRCKPTKMSVIDLSQRMAMVARARQMKG